MNPVTAAELLNHLRGQTLPLETLWARAQAAGSHWTREQLQLFLRCAPGVTYDADAQSASGPTGSGRDALTTAVIEAVRSFAGRPVPAAEIRARLPNEFVTTDEQIRALARRSPELRVVGPGLIQSIDEGREP